MVLFPAYPALRLVQALFLLALWPAAPMAAGATDGLQDQLLEQQEKMHRLHKGIETQKTKIREARDTEISLLAELEQIDRLLLAEREKLAALRQELAAAEQQLALTEMAFAEAMTRKTKLQAHVEKRLAAFYRVGKPGVINALFSAASLPEMLLYQEYFRTLFEHDRELMTAYRQGIVELDQSRLALAEQTEALHEVVVRKEKQEEILAATQQKRLALLNRVKTEKRLHQRAVKEMKAAAMQLKATLEQLRQEIDRENGEAAPAEPSGAPLEFADQRGKLTPPASGTVVSRFGEQREGKFGIVSKTNGIDIATESGAGIRAVFAGKVVYAGYLRGYGNLLIIDHGQQYYSLLSQAARLFKQKGDRVTAGEVVGIMGDSESPAFEDLHFEIRHGTEPEDPLTWLNQTDLQFKTARQTPQPAQE